MNYFTGSLLVVFIVLVAGLIAYLGDRVGHQVGRKRMTLFGLRPKYTSTIVAVGTGMMIALVAQVVALGTTPLARDAFFHLSAINNRVNELQAQADALQKHVRENNVVVDHGQLLYQQFLSILPAQSQATRMKNLSVFFDAVVDSLNRKYVPRGLKPFEGKSSDQDIKRKLEAVLADQRVQAPLVSRQVPVLIVAIADENLFPGDTISFTVAPYADLLIFRNGQPLTSVEVDGGTPIVPRIAYGQLAAAIQEIALTAGMPVYFSNALGAPSITEVAATQQQIKNGRGRFYIIARAAQDIYPHTGGIPVTFELSRKPR